MKFKFIQENVASYHNTWIQYYLKSMIWIKNNYCVENHMPFFLNQVCYIVERTALSLALHFRTEQIEMVEERYSDSDLNY